MGLFSLRRIGTLIEEKLEDRKRRIEQEKKEHAELAAVQKKALYEERIRMAPVIARERAIIEKNQTIAAIKAGKGQSGWKQGVLDAGARMNTNLNKEFSGMFGGGSGKGGGITAPTMDFSLPQSKGQPFGAWDFNLQQQPQKQPKPKKQKRRR